MHWQGALIAALVLMPIIGEAASGEPVKASAKPVKATLGLQPSSPATQAVSLDTIREAITKILEKQLNGRSAELTVTLLVPDEAPIVPAGALDLKVRALRGEDLVGRRGFQLSIVVNGKEAANLRVMAQVDAQADVVTPNRYIKPDETISAEDLTVARVPLPAGAADFVFDMQDAIGKRAVRGLPSDKPIRGSGIAQPYIVRKGDRVTIEARRGGLIIHAVGLTKSSGLVGQLITVTNQDSGKDLRAKVIGPGTVQVEF